MEQRLDKIERSVELLILMAGANMMLLVIGVSIGAVILYRMSDFRSTMFEISTSIRELLLQCIQYFQMIKEMTNITRISQNRVEQAASAAPEIVQKLEQIPEKTSDMVVEKIKSK